MVVTTGSQEFWLPRYLCSHVITIWMLGNLFTTMINCQECCDQMIAFCNFPCCLPPESQMASHWGKSSLPEQPLTAPLCSHDVSHLWHPRHPPWSVQVPLHIFTHSPQPMKYISSTLANHLPPTCLSLPPHPTSTHTTCVGLGLATSNQFPHWFWLWKASHNEWTA